MGKNTRVAVCCFSYDILQDFSVCLVDTIAFINWNVRHECDVHPVKTALFTCMQNSKHPFKVWFLALYLISQNKKSISALAWSRHCGISYNSGWLIKQKIMHAFLQAEQHKPLSGIVHINNDYLGGKRQGISDCGARGKIPFITAWNGVNGRPDQLKLPIVAHCTSTSIANWVQTALLGPCLVYTDNVPGFSGLKRMILCTGPWICALTPMLKILFFKWSILLWGMHHAIRVGNIAHPYSRICLAIEASAWFKTSIQSSCKLY